VKTHKKVVLWKSVITVTDTSEKDYIEIEIEASTGFATATLPVNIDIQKGVNFAPMFKDPVETSLTFDTTFVQNPSYTLPECFDPNEGDTCDIKV
jgi:hypothetical protein